MYIILERSVKDGSESVISVIYGERESYVHDWVSKYLGEKQRNEGEGEIQIEQLDNVYNLIKRENIVKRGYIYNSKTTVSSILSTVTILYFDGVASQYIGGSGLWRKLNNQINTRILKNMDREELCQVIDQINCHVEQKRNWTRDEYTILVRDILSNFTKKLYSAVVKYGKKNKTD